VKGKENEGCSHKEAGGPQVAGVGEKGKEKGWTIVERRGSVRRGQKGSAPLTDCMKVGGHREAGTRDGAGRREGGSERFHFFPFYFLFLGRQWRRIGPRPAGAGGKGVCRFALHAK